MIRLTLVTVAPLDVRRAADMYAKVGRCARSVPSEMLPGPWSAINFARAGVSLRRVGDLGC